MAVRNWLDLTFFLVYITITGCVRVFNCTVKNGDFY